MKTFARIVIGLLTVLPFAASAQIAPPPPPIPTVNVTDTCTPSATDGTSDTYTGQYLGICALVAAKEQGVVSSYGLSYFPGFGFFVDALNGTTADSNSQYWALYKNDVYSDTAGLSTLTVTSGDSISLKLSDFSNNVVGPVVTIRIGLLISSAPAEAAATGGSGGIWMHAPFDVPAAFRYLESVQNSDGSFG